MSNCKVIALTNQKGGVGKTTTAMRLNRNKTIFLFTGLALAVSGIVVLLVRYLKN